MTYVTVAEARKALPDILNRAAYARERTVITRHDELVFEAPAGEVDALSAMAREAMSGVAQMAVPLDVSVASGPNWASAK